MYYDIEQYKLITQTSHISFSYAPGKFNTWQLFNCQCSVNYAACNFDFKSAGIASIMHLPARRFFHQIYLSDPQAAS